MAKIKPKKEILCLLFFHVLDKSFSSLFHFSESVSSRPSETVSSQSPSQQGAAAVQKEGSDSERSSTSSGK